MRISEKAEQMKKLDFSDKGSIFFVRPPHMKNIKKSKKVKHLIVINVKNIVPWYMFYLKSIIYLDQILRALLSNKNGILNFWKSQ